MTPDQFALVRELFPLVCDLDDAARDQLLRERCPGDREVQEEVRSLARVHREAVAETTASARRSDLVTSLDSLPALACQPQPPSRWRRWYDSLGRTGRLAFAVLGVLLIQAVLLSWTYLRARHESREFVETGLRVMLNTCESSCRNLIELERSHVRSWAQGEPLREAVAARLADSAAPSPGKDQEWLRALHEAFQLRTDLELDYWLLDERGRVLGTDPRHAAALHRRCSSTALAVLDRVFDGETVVLNVRESAAWTEGLVAAGEPMMAVVTPVTALEDGQRVLAALLVRGFELERRFFDVFNQARPGRTGECYAFDQAGRLLTESRFDDQLRRIGLLGEAPSWSCLAIELRDPGGDLTRGYKASRRREAQPLTQLAAYGTAGEDGFDLDGYRDYRGVPVVGAWRWLPQHHIGIAAEIDLTETHRTERSLNSVFSMIAVLLALAAGLTLWSAIRARQPLPRVGAYSLDREIGRGGMGAVFLAHHALLRRPTAVKLIRPEHSDLDAIARFQREAHLASQLSHPNTIVIYDYGQAEDGRLYLAMELVRGHNLRELVRLAGPLAASRAIHLLEQVAGALTEAHDRGLAHRDIKPENIMACLLGGESDVVKVLDFGLAKPVAPSADQLTRHLGVAGTPAYMAPERLIEPGRNDLRSDIYSFGAVGYFVLTGREAVVAADAEQFVRALLQSPPPSPSELVGEIPPQLDELVTACLAKSPDARPATMRDVRERLRVLASKHPWDEPGAETWWGGHPPPSWDA